jgi:hypothetical protein
MRLPTLPTLSFISAGSIHSAPALVSFGASGDVLLEPFSLGNYLIVELPIDFPEESALIDAFMSLSKEGTSARH